MGLSLEDTSFARLFRKEGRAEGVVIGETQKAIEIATRLLQKGFSVEEVSEDTGLTLEQVNNIKQNINE